MLVIVESPNKIKKIQGFLGGEYEVIATKGHFRDLPKKHSGKLPESWETIKGKGDVVKALVTALKRHHSPGTPKEACVILATDPDREGEAIAWHVCQVLGIDPARAMRCRFHEITRDAVVRAIARAHRGEDVLDLNLVGAQRARRLLDRRIGYSGTAYLWKRVGSGVSAGRCLIPAAILLKEVVSRQDAKGMRVVLRGSLTTESAGRAYLQEELEDAPSDCMELVKTHFTQRRVSLDKPIGKGAVKLKEDGVIQNTLVVKAISVSGVSKSPPKPHNTSSALTAIGGSPARAMAILQSLFEKGKITYHRTESREVCQEFKHLVLGTMDGGADASSSKGGETGKEKEVAHEAIRPTHPEDEGRDGGGFGGEDDGLDDAERRAYRIIWENAVGSLYSHWIGERLMIHLEGGWTITHERTQMDGGGWLERVGRAPPTLFPEGARVLCEGDSVKITGGHISVKNEPRGKEVSETSMITLLEHSGIGRPSTYSTIIGNLSKRGLVGFRKTVVSPILEVQITTPHSKYPEWGVELVKHSKQSCSLAEFSKRCKDDNNGNGDDVIEETTREEIKERIGLTITPVGEKCLSSLLNSAYSYFFQVSYTSKMEAVLDKISSGEIRWEEFVDDVDNEIFEVESSIVGGSFKVVPETAEAPPSATRGSFPETILGREGGWVYYKGKTKFGPVVFRHAEGDESFSGRQYQKVSPKQWWVIDLSFAKGLW